MTDGVKFAKDRIALFEAEIDRLRDFVRMSERLFTEGWLGPTAETAQSNEPVADKRQSMTAAGAGVQSLKDSEPDSDEDDPLTLELDTADGDLASLRKKNGADSDRKGLFRRSTG